MSESDLDAQCLLHWQQGLRRLGAFAKRLNATQIEIEDAFVRLVAAKKVAGR
jgi:hypothetical protein